jgi:hypothetical protein
MAAIASLEFLGSAPNIFASLPWLKGRHLLGTTILAEEKKARNVGKPILLPKPCYFCSTIPLKPGGQALWCPRSRVFCLQGDGASHRTVGNVHDILQRRE